jgi:hypothetical protein
VPPRMPRLGAPSRQPEAARGRKPALPPGTTQVQEPNWRLWVPWAAPQRVARDQRFAPGGVGRALGPVAPLRPAATRSRWWALVQDSQSPRYRAQSAPDQAEAPSPPRTGTATHSATMGRPTESPAPRAARWSGPRPMTPSAFSSLPHPPGEAWAALSTGSGMRRLHPAAVAAARRSCRPANDATSSPDSSRMWRSIRSAGKPLRPWSARWKATPGARTGARTPLEPSIPRH